MTNLQAYYIMELITAVKGFTVQISLIVLYFLLLMFSCSSRYHLYIL